MSTIKNQTTVRARIATDLKHQATEILKSKGLTVSDVLRETLVRVVEQRDEPLPAPRLSEAVFEKKPSLADVKYKSGLKLLPELHQARWAERNGEMMRERTKARAAGDEAKVAELRAKILDHQKMRWDTSSTLALIEAQYRRELIDEQIKAFDARLKESESAFARLFEQARGLIEDVTAATESAFDTATGEPKPAVASTRHATGQR